MTIESALPQDRRRINIAVQYADYLSDFSIPTQKLSRIRKELFAASLHFTSIVWVKYSIHLRQHVRQQPSPRRKQTFRFRGTRSRRTRCYSQQQKFSYDARQLGIMPRCGASRKYKCYTSSANFKFDGQN